MDVHYYFNILNELFKRQNDKELAEYMVQTIIDESRELEHYYSKENEFYRILTILQDQYFPILWDGLTKMYMNVGDYGLAPWHFKSLLGSRHDYQGQSEGLLFGGKPEKFDIILNWCKENKDHIYWIAELLPVFGGPRTPESQLHPYAQTFIDEFGDKKEVLGAIAAKIGTYGWVGSIIPKLESDKAIFSHLINHKRPQVREWAQAHLDDVNRRIQFEKDREEEGY